MPKVRRVHQSLAYGDGYMQGAGQAGQVVKIVGNDTFSINTDPSVPSFGILIDNYPDGEMPGICCNGGVIELDDFEGSPSPGDALKVAASGFLTPGPGAGEQAICQVLSVGSGVIKVRLLI